MNKNPYKYKQGDDILGAMWCESEEEQCEKEADV